MKKLILIALVGLTASAFAEPTDGDNNTSNPNWFEVNCEDLEQSSGVEWIINGNMDDFVTSNGDGTIEVSGSVTNNDIIIKVANKDTDYETDSVTFTLNVITHPVPATAALPECLEGEKGGIFIRQNSDLTYSWYGAVREGKVNVMKKFDNNINTNSFDLNAFHTIKATFKNVGEERIISYTVDGVALTYNGSSNIPVCHEGVITGLGFRGEGTIKKLYGESVKRNKGLLFAPHF